MAEASLGCERLNPRILKSRESERKSKREAPIILTFIFGKTLSASNI